MLAVQQNGFSAAGLAVGAIKLGTWLLAQHQLAPPPALSLSCPELPEVHCPAPTVELPVAQVISVCVSSLLLGVGIGYALCRFHDVQRTHGRHEREAYRVVISRLGTRDACA